jgi:hypothetical protein
MAVLHVALAIDLGEMKAARDKSLLKGHAPSATVGRRSRQFEE